MGTGQHGAPSAPPYPPAGGAPYGAPGDPTASVTDRYLKYSAVIPDLDLAQTLRLHILSSQDAGMHPLLLGVHTMGLQLSRLLRLPTYNKYLELQFGDCQTFLRKIRQLSSFGAPECLPAKVSGRADTLHVLGQVLGSLVGCCVDRLGCYQPPGTPLAAHSRLSWRLCGRPYRKT